MSLYLWINLLSVSVPFIVSFHPRLQLYKQWKWLIPSLFISMLPYILWDVYFTEKGYWGFNSAYLQGASLWGLPLEEWLFFICIPYACVFTHYSLKELFPNMKISELLSKRLAEVLIGIFVLLLIFFYEKAYTRFDLLFGIVILFWARKRALTLLRVYFLTFLFMLIPFFIVNGVLTGTGIENEVVWYNDSQNMGIRMLTIPVEDSLYAFSLLLLNLLVFEQLKGQDYGKATN